MMHRMWAVFVLTVVATLAVSESRSEPPDWATDDPTVGPEPIATPRSKTQNASPLPESPPVKRTSKASDAARNAILDDIMRLHREHGDVLSGTSLASPGSSLNGEFHNAVQVLADNALDSTQLDPAPLSPTLTNPILPASRMIVPPRPSTRIVKSDSESTALSSSLRSLARQLDERANRLEDQRQFAPADRLRRLGQKMRREARTME